MFADTFVYSFTSVCISWEFERSWYKNKKMRITEDKKRKLKIKKRENGKEERKRKRPIRKRRKD